MAKREYWIIEDWISNHCFKDKVFNSYEEARAFISEYADEQATDKQGNIDEDIYNGYCEDLYAIQVNKEGLKI